MKKTLPLSTRLCYYYPYVLSAEVLSAQPVDDNDPSSLREDASTDGYCYLHVIDDLHDGAYLCRVAATPDAIHMHGYTILLSQEHLEQARPLIPYEVSFWAEGQAHTATLHAANALAALQHAMQRQRCSCVEQASVVQGDIHLASYKEVQRHVVSCGTQKASPVSSPPS
jgi:hypothetical protein